MLSLRCVGKEIKDIAKNCELARMPSGNLWCGEEREKERDEYAMGMAGIRE